MKELLTVAVTTIRHGDAKTGHQFITIEADTIQEALSSVADWLEAMANDIRAMVPRD